jgi:hypothetical protein
MAFGSSATSRSSAMSTRRTLTRRRVRTGACFGRLFGSMRSARGARSLLVPISAGRKSAALVCVGTAATVPLGAQSPAHKAHCVGCLPTCSKAEAIFIDSRKSELSAGSAWDQVCRANSLASESADIVDPDTWHGPRLDSSGSRARCAALRRPVRDAD